MQPNRLRRRTSVSTLGAGLLLLPVLATSAQAAVVVPPRGVAPSSVIAASRDDLGSVIVPSSSGEPYLLEAGSPPTGGSDRVGVDGHRADGSSAQQLAPMLFAASSLAVLAPNDSLRQLADPPAPQLGARARISTIVLDAYTRAARRLAAQQPQCGLDRALLAGIGRAESDHARGGRVDATGATVTPILGPVLDGTTPGTAAVPDTDRGRLDGNTVWDRAVGPMQFLPATWRRFGADGNNDGVADINNVYDASLAAGRYLCAGGGDLRDPTQAAAAVFQYNPSATYVATVLSWAAAYATGVTALRTPTLPTATGSIAPTPRSRTAPPSPHSRASTTPQSARDPEAGGKPGATRPVVPELSARSVVYVVKPGDNLSTISWWFHTHGYGPIYDANRSVIGADPDLIFPGQRIRITGTTMTMGG